MPIKTLLFCCLLILIVSCQESEYSRLVKTEMDKNIVNDSLFLGMKFGITKQKFFDVCWKLNNQRIISHSSSNNFVKYPLPTKQGDSISNQINMLFYGIFNEEKIMTGMDLRFYYEAWALWNENSHAEKLVPIVQDSLLKWYPGNDFMKVQLKKSKKEIIVKVDGNRRIIIEAPENNKEVNVTIDDLRYVID